MNRLKIYPAAGGDCIGWFMPTNGKKPIICCPTCGGGLLGDDTPHEICENGDVNASVVCRHNGCDFHEFVNLVGWNGGHISRNPQTWIPGDKEHHHC